MDKQEKLFHQLQHISVRRSDEHRAWLRLFYSSLIVHAVLLLGLFNSQNAGVRWQLLVIAGFAVIATVTVTLVMLRVLRAVETTEIISNRIEKKLVESSELCDDMAYFVVNGNKPMRYISAKAVLYSFNGLMISFWGIVFCYVVFLELRS